MEPAAVVPLTTSADPASACALLAGEALIDRALGAVRHRVAASRIVVVAAHPFAGLVADRVGPGVVVLGVGPAVGGRQAIRIGLEYLAEQCVSAILLHDWRHPLAPREVTDRVLAELEAGGRVVVPVTPMTDSVKEVDAGGAVVATVDRATLRNVQYPRGFATEALADLLAQDGDLVAAALAGGVPVATVDGHADAGRFTLPADTALLEAIIATRG